MIRDRLVALVRSFLIPERQPSYKDAFELVANCHHADQRRHAEFWLRCLTSLRVSRAARRVTFTAYASDIDSALVFEWMSDHGRINVWVHERPADSCWAFVFTTEETFHAESGPLGDIQPSKFMEQLERLGADTAKNRQATPGVMR